VSANKHPTKHTRGFENLCGLSKGIKTQFTGEVPRVFYRGMSFFSREVPKFFCEGMALTPGVQYSPEESFFIQKHKLDARGIRQHLRRYFSIPQRDNVTTSASRIGIDLEIQIVRLQKVLKPSLLAKSRESFIEGCRSLAAKSRSFFVREWLACPL
jgi:hypothetical protein